MPITAVFGNRHKTKDETGYGIETGEKKRVKEALARKRNRKKIRKEQD